MSALELAQALHAARRSCRAAELTGDSATATQAQAEIARLRKSLFALAPEERALALFDPGVPMACLPVRLETAFMGDGHLRLRVYPDTVHIGGHDPRITKTELALAQDVLARSGTGEDAALHAWMDTLTGAGRGAYIRAEVIAGRAQIRPDGADDLAVRAAALPDHWQLTLSWGARSETIPFPDMVAEPLSLGPSPEDVGGLLGPDALSRLWQGGRAPETGFAWMVDFDAARAAGMAIEVELAALPGLSEHLRAGGEIDAVSVTGVRWADPMAARDTLAELLQGHAMQRDLRIAEQGSATRNDADRRTPAPPEMRDGPNVARLRRALGLGQGALMLCGDTPRDEDQTAAHVASALWPGTAGLYAEACLGQDADSVEPLRGFFRDALRARGPLAALRIGSEPYGILPLTVSNSADPVPGTPLEEAIARRLNVLRGRMRMRPLATRPPENYETWLDLFGTEPHPGTLLGVPFGALNQPLSRFAGSLLDALDLPFARSTLSGTTAIPTLIEISPRLPLSRYAADARQRTDNVVTLVLGTRSLAELMALLPRDRWPVHPWREMPLVRKLRFDRARWRVEQDGAQPGDPVTFTLLRHAMFCHYAALMRAAIRARGEIPASLSDPEKGPGHIPLFEQFSAVTGLDPEALTLPLAPEAARQLQLPDTLREQNAELARAMDALQRLDAADPEAFELAVREHLALISYRPDAWASAFDATRLGRMRSTAPEGVLLAGYGRVCGLRPGGQPTGKEALLARSPDQAITAAALRQGMKARMKDGLDAGGLAVNLTSGRVGPAQEVLAGLRAGRSLGEVLGQRLEQAARRALASRPDVLHATIEELRRRFPLREGLRADAGKGASGADICDGMRAIRALFDAPSDIPAAALQIVQDSAEIIEALADLGMAEAVHGLITAGPDRAGAALDALSRGDSLPDRFEVVEDRRSGAGLEMDISVLGAARPVPAAPGDSPEAVSLAQGVAAGPIAGIVDHWLGDLSRFGVWMQVGDSPPDWVSLDGFGIDPVALVMGVRPTGEDILTRLRPEARRVTPDVPGPDGAPSFARSCVMFDRLRRFLAEATPIGADPKLADEADARARRAFVAGTAQRVIDALRRDGPDALGLALALGRADAVATGLGPTERADHAARVATRLVEDLAAFEAGGGYERIFGASLPTAPVLPLPARDMLRAQLVQAPGLRAAHGIMPLTHWLFDVAATRPRVQAMIDAAEACEALRDDTVLSLYPHQQGSAPHWAGINAAPGTPISHAGLIVSDCPMPEGGVMIDSWSEVLPDSHIDAALAIEAQAPRARAPQAILLALSADETPLAETAPLVALDRLFALMAERALAPQDMGDALRLPPVMSFKEPAQ